MSDFQDHSASAAAPRPATAAHLARFKREQLIVDYLNRGVGIAEIAARIGVGEKRMRAIVREILARRQPAAPQEFAAIQVSRLNEALLVAFSAMTDMNLKAVDRVVRIVRELDRYHGIGVARRRVREPRARTKVPALAPPADGALAFSAAAWVCRLEIEPPTRAAVPESLVLMSGAGGDAARRTFAGGVLYPSFETPAARAPQDEEVEYASNDRPENPPQASEKPESTPGNGWPAAPSPSAPIAAVPPAAGFRGVRVRAVLNGVAAC
jgi:hypothetical protein